MRIAIVNDLALAREILRQLVLTVPGHVVAWTAENGEEAVRKAVADPPDVILMDLIMPVMDGVEATRRIMQQRPCPILVVTSTITGNFTRVYEAMGHGALDAVNTPVMGPGGKIKEGEGLLARLAKLDRPAVNASLTSVFRSPAPQLAGREEPKTALPPLVALGASTGGPEALSRILSEFPASFPATGIITQHIAADFAPNLATWLQGQARVKVRVARAGDELQLGGFYVAASDDHLILGEDQRLAYTAEPVNYPYRPSVDALFYSLAAYWRRPGVAVLLTGMGADGARGLLKLRQAGWHTIAQDQATCIVYGMPQAAAQLNAACEVLPLTQIAAAIVRRVSIMR